MKHYIMSFATLIFDKLIYKYSSNFNFIKKDLLMSNMKINFKSYINCVFLLSLISFIISIIITSIIFFISNINILIPLPIMIILISILISSSTFISLIYYPTQKVNKIRKNIELNLPFALNYMNAISESGIPPHLIFKLIGKFDDFGEISKKMREIIRNIEFFGLDELTAVREVLKKIPSKDFKQILIGFITTIESGGNLNLFFKKSAEKSLFDWKIKREKFLQQLSTYTELYIGIFIAAPLFLISLLAIMSFIQPNIAGFDIITITKISIYGIIPLINLIFLFFIREVNLDI